MARKVPSTHNIDALTRDELVIAKAGRDAWDAITKTFSTWIVLGEAIVMFRTKANAIGGRQTFQRLLDQNGLGKIDGGEISRLEKIMANLDAVRVWYAKLAQNQKIAWASPSSVIRHAVGSDAKRLFAPKKKGGGKNKTVIKPSIAANDSAFDAANERVKELEEELAVTKQKTNLDGKNFKDRPLQERRQFVDDAGLDVLIKSAAPAEQEKLRKVPKVLTIEQHFAAVLDLLMQEDRDTIRDHISRFQRDLNKAEKAKPRTAKEQEERRVLEQVAKEMAGAINTVMAPPQAKAVTDAATKPALEWKQSGDGESEAAGAKGRYLIQPVTWRNKRATHFVAKLEPATPDFMDAKFVTLSNRVSFKAAKAAAEDHHAKS